MAISATQVLEIRTAGNDLNGGGFNSAAAGVDYSQQDTKNTVGNNISTTDAVAVGTTTITSATATFTSDIVGNLVYFQGGTGAIGAQWRQVNTFTNSTTIVIDQAIAASTGMTMNIGGAMASLGGASLAGAGVALRYWIKTGTYTQLSSSINVAGGRWGRSLANAFVIGYQTSRGDYGTAPVLSVAGGTGSGSGIIDSSGSTFFGNIHVDGNAVAACNGFNSDSQDIFFRCKAIDCPGAGFTLVTNGTSIECAATGCGTGGWNTSSGVMIDCVAFANTAPGFLHGSAAIMINCIAYGNTGASTDGFIANVGGATIYRNCVSYNNGRDGFRFVNNQRINITNCIAEDNVGIGFNAGGGATSPILVRNCAAFSNGTDVSLSTGNAVFQIPSVIIGTGSFFTNAAAGDFSLNNTSGAGAALRAAGYPGTYPEALTVGYADIGAAQHQDSGSGGGPINSLFIG